MNTPADDHHANPPITRRDVLRAGAAALAVPAIIRADAPASQPTSSRAASSRPTSMAAAAQTIPTNVLGRTGVAVTRLAMGAGYPGYGRRLLERAYRSGVRYFDNAYGYGNGVQERELGDWLAATGRRADVFVVTKDGVCAPKDFYTKVVRRRETLHVDTIDLMMIHGIEDPELPRDRDGSWRTIKDRLVREKKIRFMGFSTHADMPKRIACITNAAGSAWVDVAMVACDPLLLRTDVALNRAIDACAKAGVGLVAMKTTRGLGRKAAQRRGLPEGQAPTESMPGFETLGLSAFGAIHAGMWSDGRFAAVCSAMLNITMIDENTRNAREFRGPLDAEHRKRLEDGMRTLARATCPNCDGSCRRAAGTQTDFAAIARCVAYAAEDGNRAGARALYAALPPEARDWTGANLGAVSTACHSKLDFEAICRCAREWLG